MAISLYRHIYEMLDETVDAQVDEPTLHRLSLLVLGIIGSRSSKPSRIAQAIQRLGLSGATVESIERQVRRIENDPEISAGLCLHPFARTWLRWGRPRELVLIIDPTTQDERVVLLTVSVWYRGRALPLAFAAWPANQPLTGARFWERVAALLAVVADLLPNHIPITWLADRAFGTPQFTDLLTPYGWHYVVRVQGQTRCRDRRGRVRTVASLVAQPRQRAKLSGEAFKKQGWRAASVIAHWGRRHTAPLCLVTDRGAHWQVLYLYRQRYAIEASFRDFKSQGWDWEGNQVTILAPLERLLVGMALATWFTLMAGSQVAAELLRRPPTGRRRTRAWVAKHSLFSLGLQRLDEWWHHTTLAPVRGRLSDWDAPDWADPLHAHQARAFVFGLSR